MRVLLTSASFRRDYGGPAYSVSRLGLALAVNGASVALWAPDGSAKQAQELWANSAFDQMPVTLAGKLQPSIETLGGVDIIHDSGVWRPHNHELASEARRRGTIRVVSTRGMLDPWALEHKRLKKMLAWRLYQKRDLKSAQALHVTSDTELAYVQSLRLGAPIWHVPNGVDLPPVENIAFRDSNVHPRRAVFLGRLHPVKGLPALLDAWARVQPEGWELILAGPDQAGYGKQLVSLIEKGGLYAAVRLVGEVAGEAKSKLMRGSDFLVLPSKSESFGMVVAEALAYGLPVLASTNVPWPQLEREHCGWRVAAKTSALEGALRKITMLPKEELADAGRRGRALVAREYGWPAIAKTLMVRYETLMAEKALVSGPAKNLQC